MGLAHPAHILFFFFQNFRQRDPRVALSRYRPPAHLPCYASGVLILTPARRRILSSFFLSFFLFISTKMNDRCSVARSLISVSCTCGVLYEGRADKRGKCIRITKPQLPTLVHCFAIGQVFSGPQATRDGSPDGVGCMCPGQTVKTRGEAESLSCSLYPL